MAPPGSYRPPDLAAQTPSWLSWTNWLAIIEDLYQAGATLVILVGAAWLTAEAYRRRKWADATGGLGCLSVIAIFIFIMFLIGGWALVGQFRIMREWAAFSRTCPMGQIMDIPLRMGHVF